MRLVLRLSHNLPHDVLFDIKLENLTDCCITYNSIHSGFILAQGPVHLVYKYLSPNALIR